MTGSIGNLREGPDERRLAYWGQLPSSIALCARSSFSIFPSEAGEFPISCSNQLLYLLITLAY